MDNINIRGKINKLNNNTKEILESVLTDSIIEINCRNRVNEDILKRIVLVYLSLFDDKEYLEYDDLKASEKNIICRIISKGIASIYVDDEYITDDNAKDKLVIIDDLINLLCFLLHNLNYLTKIIIIW